MLLHKSIEHDSRVKRAAGALAGAGHEVTVLHLPPVRGEHDGRHDGYKVASVTPGRRAALLPPPVRRAVAAVAFARAAHRLRPEAVHAHDVAMLPPAWLAARRNGILVYDTHELATGVPYRGLPWGALVRTIERLLVPRCALVITVSDGIADRLSQLYSTRRAPLVVRNIPDPADYVEAAAFDLRAASGIEPGAPLVLHLGAAGADRGCEALVRAMKRLPEDVALVFLGAGTANGRRLMAEAERAAVDRRVHVRPPVEVEQVLAAARQASVGVSLLQDSCENHRLALPNKVFEYLGAGIPVVAAQLPELSRALRDRPGVFLVDPSEETSIAAGLADALGHAGPAPRSPFQWSEEASRLIASYAELADERRETGARRAVVLVRNGVDHDARVQRQARLLDSMGFETTVVGVRADAGVGGAEERIGNSRLVRVDPGGTLRRLSRRTGRRSASIAAVYSARAPAQTSPGSAGARARLRRLAMTVDFYRRALGVVLRERPEVVHANDYNTAWVGVAAKWLTGARLVYDSHELWPDRNLRPEPRAWLLLCEALFVRAADRVLTTSPGYARVMARRYRIKPPTVIRNVPDWSAEDDGRGAGPPLAVYFGALTRHRGLPTALRALARLPELRMRLVGPEAWGYRATLRELADELGVADRVELLDPVPPEQAASVLVDADVGLALIEPVCLSYRMTLPNKLYEYVAAGLPVLASDVPVLATEVRRHGLGRVANPTDPSAVATALREMLDSEAQRQFREAAARLGTVTAWERERQKLADAYGSLAQR